MKREELDYDLPQERIAQYPPARRDGGRLLEVGAVGVTHRWVKEWASLVPSGALVVLNDTRVMKARVFGTREDTGGKVELLFIAATEHAGEPAWAVIAKAKRPLVTGDRIQVHDEVLRVLGRTEHSEALVSAPREVGALLERQGHVPLPPYMHRDDEPADEQRYQTVFAEHWGSAAAPTAGLHLTNEALAELRARDVDVGFTTLHVGPGTFRPVSTETLDAHPMHREQYEVSATLCRQVEAARARQAPVVAVGTTVVRALESAADAQGKLTAQRAETGLLIAPGYRFRVVEALLTNFHAPRSTLLALVFAFAGQTRIRAAYNQAIEHGYRFLSYGDAMWIPKRLS